MANGDKDHYTIINRSVLTNAEGSCWFRRAPADLESFVLLPTVCATQFGKWYVTVIWQSEVLNMSPPTRWSKTTNYICTEKVAVSVQVRGCTFRSLVYDSLLFAVPGIMLQCVKQLAVDTHTHTTTLSVWLGQTQTSPEGKVMQRPAGNEKGVGKKRFTADALHSAEKKSLTFPTLLLGLCFWVVSQTISQP